MAMTFPVVLEIAGAYVVIGVILSLAAITVWIEHTGQLPPKLDGTRLGCVLDDRDRAHLLDLALAEDREVAALDSLYELPAREHPGWGL